MGFFQETVLLLPPLGSCTSLLSFNLTAGWTREFRFEYSVRSQASLCTRVQLKCRFLGPDPGFSGSEVENPEVLNEDLVTSTQAQ